MQFGPRFRVLHDAVSAFLRDALGGFLAGGVFKIQSGLLWFYLTARSSSRQLLVFQYYIHGIFFAGPSLFAPKMSYDFLCARECPIR